MNLGKTLLKRKYLILIIWIVVLLLSVPAIFGYSSYLNYTNSGASPAHTESSEAGVILGNFTSTNQSLSIVIYGNPLNNKDLANQTLSLQSTIMKQGFLNMSSTSSVYTAYSSYLDNVTLKYSSSYIDADYNSISAMAQSFFTFPEAFYNQWGQLGFKSSYIPMAASNAGYNGSLFEKTFLDQVKNQSATPVLAVENSSQIAIMDVFGVTNFTTSIVHSMSFMNYTNPESISKATAYYVSGTTPYNVSWELVYSAANYQNPGNTYVRYFGVLDAPSFILAQSVSPDHKIFLVSVDFNVKSGYEYKNGSSPAEIAFPTIQKEANNIYGNRANVTGNGAISYQTSQVTAKSGFAFGLIFIFLLIAIFVTIVSYWASILGLIFVGISLLLGYVSVFIAGVLTGSVSFIVNYTLTAVILGVSTDYLVFLLARYKQEVREGKSNEEALEISISRAGKAVVISGITVAFTLLTFSLVSEFFSWGIVLFQAIIYTVLLQTTLLPIAMSFLKKRLLMKIGSKPMLEEDAKKRRFYKAAALTQKRALAVAIVIIIVGSAGFYFFLSVPTTYNFNTGLPESLSSVQALNAIDEHFGSGNIFPTFVIYKSDFHNATLSNAQQAKLMAVATSLSKLTDVKSISGPFISGRNVTSAVNYSSYEIQNGKYFVYVLSLKTSPYGATALKLVSNLRENNSYVVGGITSTVIDEKAQNARIYSELEIFIVIAIFVILLVAFRKIRYPVISITGTLFSISWSTFILYFISLYILHIALIYLIPIILFIILFSLGNDYTVFISSRVIEEVNKRGFNEGLRRGMASSANTVTALGIILAISLGSLAFIPVAFLEELGIAFVISLLIDTFVIRTFYFPAMLTLFHRGSREKDN